MRIRFAGAVCLLSLTAAAGGCAKSNPVQPTATPTPTPPAPVPVPVVISAPTPVTPTNGATTNGWPTLTVTDAVRTGPAAALVYRFDISSSSAFGTIIVTGTVSESTGQTSFTPPPNTPPPAQTALFWRAIAIDPINVVASPASAVQNFTYASPPTQASIIATQEGAVLWPGTQPPGTAGQATLGNGWGVGLRTSFDGVTFLSPELDQLRVFDLLDRGLDPQSAIDWLHANGYSTVAAYYPSVAVIGFRYSYLALINGHWDVVFKVGA